MFNTCQIVCPSVPKLFFVLLQYFSLPQPNSIKLLQKLVITILISSLNFGDVSVTVLEYQSYAPLEMGKIC